MPRALEALYGGEVKYRRPVEVTIALVYLLFAGLVMAISCVVDVVRLLLA